MDELYITVAEIARACHISSTQVIQSNWHYQVPTVLVGGTRRFFRQDGEKLIQLIQNKARTQAAKLANQVKSFSPREEKETT